VLELVVVGFAVELVVVLEVVVVVGSVVEGGSSMLAQT
jgi:hypothetical protein